MKSIKKILVPTDFSEHAGAAYEHAQEIAQKFDAEIDLIHIVPTMKYFRESLSGMGEPISLFDDVYPKAQERAIDSLKDTMNEHIAKEFQGKPIVKIDRTPASRISDIAKEGKYDLIVMASRGEHGTHLLRGSTSEKVIRHSEVPVFSVDAEMSSEKLQRILLPTDGSETSFSALPIALTLAATYEADIILYHVIELYGSELDDYPIDKEKTGDSNIYKTLIDRLEKSLSSEDNVTLKRLKEDFNDQLVITDGASSLNINITTTMGKGVSAHRGIVEYAPENADVVVMATHGQSGLAHFFLGSTTEKVAQHLEMPVLTVRPQKEKLKQKKS